MFYESLFCEITKHRRADIFIDFIMNIILFFHFWIALVINVLSLLTLISASCSYVMRQHLSGQTFFVFFNQNFKKDNTETYIINQWKVNMVLIDSHGWRRHSFFIYSEQLLIIEISQLSDLLHRCRNIFMCTMTKSTNFNYKSIPNNGHYKVFQITRIIISNVLKNI
jgi:hypothetical protein